MAHHDGLSQGIDEVSTHMTALSPAQATVLARWSFGMVLAQSCGITSVACVLAQLLGQKENTVRQRLRESYLDDAEKRGAQRADLDVTTCFAPLLGWIRAWWEPPARRRALAMDASTVGQRFTVLTISVVYRGCALPVAWVVRPACTKGAWNPHWRRLVTLLAAAVPATWTVIVLADRGLYARWLDRPIVKPGWQPFLRITVQGNVRPHGETRFRPLRSLVPQVGCAWAGTARCFSSRAAALDCTLLARWDAGYTDPWLIVTDLAPHIADVAWYGMRSWRECGYKDTNRGGWQWEQTKLTNPQRATRLWLAIALATVWVVRVGGEAEATLPASSLEDLPDTHIARCRSTRRSRPRLLRCFRRGMLILGASLVRGDALPLGRFIPEPWPHRAPILTLPQYDQAEMNLVAA